MSETEDIAAEVLAAEAARRPIAPFTERRPGFDLTRAYRVAEAVRRQREASGAHVVGRKLGFTNRTIWDEYGVYAPIWGVLYDATVRDAVPGENTLSLAALMEPRIEPEIAFGIARAPEPGMDEAAILDCLAWVAHGIEIVQSIFPGWRFAAADTVAQNALHGRYLLGPRVKMRRDFLAPLAKFEIVLSRDGAEVDRGKAANVLDGPLSALRHLNEMRIDPPLRPGEFVTTGTVTRAFPVAPGERWSTRIEGLELDGLSVRFEP
jgi:2-oxo-3-hexenedioate decarboxylase